MDIVTRNFLFLVFQFKKMEIFDQNKIFSALLILVKNQFFIKIFK